MLNFNCWKALRQSRMLTGVLLQASSVAIGALFWGRAIFTALTAVGFASWSLTIAICASTSIFVLFLLMLKQITRMLLYVEQTTNIWPAEREVFAIISHVIFILCGLQTICVSLIMIKFELKLFGDVLLVIPSIIFISIVPIQNWFGLFSSEVVSSSVRCLQAKPVVAKVRGEAWSK